MRLSRRLATLAARRCSPAASTPPAARRRRRPHISLATLQRVTRTLSSDEYRGPRARHAPARTRTVALLVAGVRARRAPARQQRQLVPGRAAGRDHRCRAARGSTIAGAAAPASASPTAPISSAPPTAPSRASRSTTARSSSSATASTRPSAAGTIMPGSTCAARPWSSWSTIPTGRRQGLEGPFNGRAMTYYGRWTYKYRGSGPAGRRRRAHRPRHRAGLLWLERGREQLDRAAALHADRRTTAPTRPR